MTAIAIDAAQLYPLLLDEVQRQLKIHPDIRLMGVWSGGGWLVERLAKDCPQLGQVGVISSSLHRDDYHRKGMRFDGDATRIPFEVDGADILLIDDVLATGRTIRAVLNELYDFGRPSRVRLLVLVDRGGRELPIQADWAAARVSLPENQRISLVRPSSPGSLDDFSFKVEPKA